MQSEQPHQPPSAGDDGDDGISGALAGGEGTNSGLWPRSNSAPEYGFEPESGFGSNFDSGPGFGPMSDIGAEAHSGSDLGSRSGFGPGSGSEGLGDVGPGNPGDGGRPGRPARWWAKPLLVSVTALAAMAVLTLATVTQLPDAKAGADAGPAAENPSASSLTAAPTSTAPTPSTSSPTPPASPTAAATTSKPALSAAASVRKAVDKLPGTGDLAVAVTDLDGAADDTSYDTSDQDGNTYDTASIVKVDILSTLLLQNQRAGTHLTSNQRSLATAMIEQSDNNAASALWDAIGRAGGLDAANNTFGLSDTQGGAGEVWGLTQTTASDQLTLLQVVFGGSGSPLSAASRTYIQGLMDSITPGQRWGVSAADSDDTGFALKNGWLQRTTTGLWDINSIGEVTYDGHRLLIAVLSSGQPSEQGGIGLVESAALAVAKAVRT